MSKTKVDKNQEMSLGAKDTVLVTYQTKWFDLVKVPGIILNANRNTGYPFKVILQDDNKKKINLGHNDDGGAPGSGPFMYCSLEHLKLVKKYVPQRLKGTIKNTWKVGDKFTPKQDFCMEQDNDDDCTGVTKEMIASCKNKELKIVAIINRCDINWLLDGVENYVWLAEWIDPIE